MLLLPMEDEGDFLRLAGLPASDDLEVGDWVTRLDGDPETGPGGWVIMLDSSLGDGDDPGEDREVEVEIELLEEPPGVDGGDEDRVVEVSVGGPAELFASGSEVAVTGAEARAYRIRLALSVGAEPFRLRVQSWPGAAGPARVLRERVEECDPPNPAFGLPEAEAGLAAAARIGRDVDGRPGARDLSAALGAIHAQNTLRGRADEYSDYFASAYDWSPDDASGSNADGYGVKRGGMGWRSPVRWKVIWQRKLDTTERVTGRTGSIWSTPTAEDDPPRTRAMVWRWSCTPMAQVANRFGSVGDAPGESCLPRDTVVSVRLVQLPGRPARTRVEIEHRDVPLEWVDDLDAWWRFQLAILAQRAE